MPAVVVREYGQDVSRVFPNTADGRRQAVELRDVAERTGRFVAWLDKAARPEDIPGVERR